MTVALERRDGVLIATIANAPVNALSQVERQGLVDAVAAADGDPALLGLVIRGENATFIAGADIREFGAPPQPPHLPDITAAIEGAAKPVVAAIAGQALGGGLEVALACHWRVATADAKFGLPEATLGIVPGAGGTQRLPRLIDPLLAATMVSGGKSIDAATALDAGLIDDVTAPDALIAAALHRIKGATASGLAGRRLSTRPPQPSDPAALARLRSGVQRSARGAEAPVAALDLIDAALALPFAEGMARERATFLRLRGGAQAAALRHIFFAERAAARPPQGCADVQPLPVGRVGVIGAGTMGTGIAMSLAEAGLAVTLVEMSRDALRRGLDRIATTYRESVDRGRLTRESAGALIAGITGSVDYGSLAQVDLVIEAAFESMEVKREIFRRLDQVARPGAILATNTSYLNIDEIAASISRPEAVVGLHYFSPANVMKLLEIVRGRQTSPQVLMTALSLAKRTRKVPVVAGVCNGFIGNRMLKAYVRESGLLLLEGATPQQVDAAMTGFGMALGPFAVADLSGIDIGYKARRAMPEGSYEPMATMVHDALVEAGQLGRKTGCGFYRYDAEGKGATPNPAVAGMIDAARASADIAPRAIADDEIVRRCVLALANEGGFILDDGIAARAGDIDVVYVNGYGFPRHRGGPLFFAGTLDRDQLRSAMSDYGSTRFGRWWRPSAYLLSIMDGQAEY